VVARVFGKVDGVEVNLEYMEGDRWEVPVPLDLDGEYVVEIIAEDEAGNQAFVTRMLYTVDAGNICIHLLPPDGYLFERQPQIYIFDRLQPMCREVTV
jgi:hypothetical protein